MQTFDVWDKTPLGWRPADGWTGEWRAWFRAPGRDDGQRRHRVRLIQEHVRNAVAKLPILERRIIEGHYFDGHSLSQLADEIGLPKTRIQVLYRRGLGRLRTALADFVVATFGIRAVILPDCPICHAAWRGTAEDLLDEKTPEITWGELARRLERAVGWTPTTIQVVIGHQKRHRAYAVEGVSGTGLDSIRAINSEEVPW
ncbi:MAG: sigma-70 family RNA polymerase sigma factor [Candidatus Zixiibacteriota bacterium]